MKNRLSSTLAVLSASLLSSYAFSIGFVEGTRIKTTTGNANVEDIMVYDEVVSCDLSKCTVGIVSRLVDEGSRTMTITTDDGMSVTCSVDQYFFADGSWSRASDLRSGWTLITPDQMVKTIKSIEEGNYERVYSFEVDTDHTFYASDLLVHNPYGLGGGPYGQSNHVISNAPQISKSTSIAAAGGCVGGAVSGAVKGQVGLASVAINCASAAVGTIAGKAVISSLSK